MHTGVQLVRATAPNPEGKALTRSAARMKAPIKQRSNVCYFLYSMVKYVQEFLRKRDTKKTQQKQENRETQQLERSTNHDRTGQRTEKSI